MTRKCNASYVDTILKTSFDKVSNFLLDVLLRVWILNTDKLILCEMNKFSHELKMSKPIEVFVNTYTYWSGKYTASRHVIDLQKKTSAFKQLIEEVNKQGISKHHLELLIEKSQKVTSLPKEG